MLPEFEHIQQELYELVTVPDDGFYLIFDRLRDENKNELIHMLVYLNKILDFSISDGTGESLRVTHIQFSCLDEKFLVPILEFITIKFFMLALAKPPEMIDDESNIPFVNDQVETLSRLLKNQPAPQNASRDNRAFQKYNSARKDRKEQIGFYNSLKCLDVHCCRDFSPNTLINTLNRDIQQLVGKHFKNALYAVAMERLNFKEKPPRTSFVVLNSEYDRNAINGMDTGGARCLLDRIENVIQFNCRSRQMHKGFDRVVLERLNSNEGTSFKNLITLSFDKEDFSLGRTIRRLGSAGYTHKVRSGDSSAQPYLFHPGEIDHLLCRRSLPVEVEMLGATTEPWQELLVLYSENEGLHELCSIKLRNIYSLCCTVRCKELILQELFDESHTSCLISRSTSVNLAELSNSLRGKIKALMDETLESVIMAWKGMYMNIVRFVQGHTCSIVIPRMIVGHPLFDEIRSCLRQLNARYVQWHDLKKDDIQVERLVILDYRDTGYIFRLYPNIFEVSLPPAQRAKGFFLDLFFLEQYERSFYLYRQALFKRLMDHPFRRKAMGWSALLQKLEKDRPMVGEELPNEWDLDDESSIRTDRVSVEIRFMNGSKKNYHPTQPFITDWGNDQGYHVVWAEHLAESGSSSFGIQPLEDLYEGLELFRITGKERVELNALSAQYRLNNGESKCQLWRVLLKRINKEKAYVDLSLAAMKAGCEMVRRSHFEEEWLNQDSSLIIPRSKRLFKVVCEHLGLPSFYFRAMLKMRVEEKWNSRQSRHKMNRLLEGMVQVGMFNQGMLQNSEQSWHHDLQSIIDRYDLEDIGITTDNIEVELISLAELLKENIQLEQIQSVIKK